MGAKGSSVQPSRPFLKPCRTLCPEACASVRHGNQPPASLVGSSRMPLRKAKRRLGDAMGKILESRNMFAVP